MMGNPPLDFLMKNRHTLNYWNKQGMVKSLRNRSRGRANVLLRSGQWIAQTEVSGQTLEQREKHWAGREKELLLDFMKQILRWLPEERPSAETLLEHEFKSEAFDPVD